MDYGWFDLVGNIGVLLMVIAYLLLQLEKLSSSALSYLAIVSFQPFGVLNGGVLVADHFVWTGQATISQARVLDSSRPEFEL